ncbi:MAG: hypothetical protein GTO53_06260 [Planctomycetales bacterium]|nr:hypothetical protein [Planctomycetales bacterium]NIM08745.1 hypothetical protein [Planctomycetales bacterium]NIN08213.1 hypothetical protein [Planctomycetales bacterium]NIN77341.1 hypothetical protein [Planctomycetales bacterium]NIO46328.1 hypothetical protein [Planctomycetales bacterium]
MDQLIQALRPKVTAGELAQLAPQFEEFCHALRAHEASESEILERGFNFNIEEAQ